VASAEGLVEMLEGVVWMINLESIIVVKEEYNVEPDHVRTIICNIHTSPLW
jgi:hypothetical protein